MELPSPTWWKFLFLLLVVLAVVTMNLSINHASAANQLRNETDRLALLEFKHQIYDDPHGVLNSWNHSYPHCQWQGVTCDTRHGRVTALTLTGKSLSGTISPHVGNLSFMKFIHLGENQFHGDIPQDVGRLFRLRYLNLSSNVLTGEIPVNLSHCSRMTTVSLSRNKLVGKIPTELTSLKKLEKLHISRNNLTGGIPSSIGNLSLLTELVLVQNNLGGSFPNEISSLTSLTILGVAGNRLSGMFPPSIYNISSIVLISAADNLLYGSLPANIGLTLRNLQALGIGGNRFSGNIPISIGNASRLEILDLPDNKIEGQVPVNLGELPNLRRLHLGGNLLGSNSAGDLGFFASLTNSTNLELVALYRNNFGGEMPKVISNLSYQLTQLLIADNQLSGIIPEGLGNLVNLYALDVADNALSGSIPNDLGKLRNLVYLGLGANQLSGEILSTVSNITSLFLVDLSTNRFEGSISENLGTYQNLQYLDVSENNFSGIMSPQFFIMHLSLVHLDLAHNSLSGSLPSEVGMLKHLEVLNVSYNKFSGEIAPSIADCSNLQHLHMHANLFHGTIPPKMASLKSIQELDLSSNSLTGQIPRDLEKLNSLKYLNLSYNDLEGEIPTTGVFGNATQVSLIGNDKLCGGISELDLPACLVKKSQKGKLKVIKVSSIALSVIVLVLCILALYYVMYRKRYQRKASFSTLPWRIDEHTRISYHELHRATSGFSPENIIGSGSFGVVYKGRLDKHENRLVAVKVLDLQKSGASKSFMAECKALSNIRHRNVVSIITYCSSIDSRGHEFKALVYELMENGNLDSWLHPETSDQATSSTNLNVLQRLNIAIDVASALHYLHNHCETGIVHCDLKPSNILLDNDLVAHVGDFGLARLLPKAVSTSSEQATNSTIAVKGSIGYAAPEYGMGLQVSRKGDVHSYGILLLEIFTGKRPTDDMFKDGLNLPNYVKMALPQHAFKILDQKLLSKGYENRQMDVQADLKGYENRQMDVQADLNNDEEKMGCITSILKIGIKCSTTLPIDRMDTDEIVRKLHLIRDHFLANKLNGADLDI